MQILYPVQVKRVTKGHKNMRDRMKGSLHCYLLHVGTNITLWLLFELGQSKRERDSSSNILPASRSTTQLDHNPCNSYKSPIRSRNPRLQQRRCG